MAEEVSPDRFMAGARIGDYHVEQEVGEDPTGVVYVATHVVLPRKSHLKVAHVGSRPAAVQLLREACILEAVAHPGHPGIPRVHECGMLADRRPWSAIEILTGITFEHFAGGGPLALPEVAMVMRDVADVLRHAHDRGVVHGALTAGAIVRTHRRRGGYAVCDWSQARTHDGEADIAIDPRSDIHALAAIAVRALTGGPPAPELAAATSCPVAPPELSGLIDQMLAEPVLRPTAREVFDRSHWLCETLEVAPLAERARWTPPQGYAVADAATTRPPAEDGTGFSVRIGRSRSS